MKEADKRFKHGHASKSGRSKEYDCWAAMIKRCEYKRHKDYARYGGRGIAVCDDWRSDFAKFLSDMGHHPGPGWTLDRIDPNGNYAPQNCRWATQHEQANNKRNVRLIEIDGRLMSASQWSTHSGVPFTVVRQRLYSGWPARDAVFMPVAAGKSHASRARSALTQLKKDSANG